jgi:hypothetical protein
MSEELDKEIARITGDVDSPLGTGFRNESVSMCSFRQHGLRIRCRETKEKGEI